MSPLDTVAAFRRVERALRVREATLTGAEKLHSFQTRLWLRHMASTYLTLAERLASATLKEKK